MHYVIAFVVYCAVVFLMAFVWNIALFRDSYSSLAGEFLREPPLFASGLAAIAIQAIAMVTAFGLLYPTSQMDPLQGMKIAFIVNIGTVTYGALVIPGKFDIASVGSWISLETAYGLVVTVLVGLALAAVWTYAA